MVRLVCLSDTHGSHEEVFVPEGDVLVYAGDACSYGTLVDLGTFARWFRAQPHPHKVFVAGNHDWPFQRDPQAARSVLGNRVTYLQDAEALVAGLRFYGSPWQPAFMNWAFNLPRRGAALKACWDLIPEGLDVLVTHGPPWGTLDADPTGVSQGCELLAEAVWQVRPRVHIFGHLHSGYGREVHPHRTYLNVSICDENLDPTHPVQVLDLE